MKMVDIALNATKHGLSVLPIEPGLKKPARGLEWKKFQEKIADESEIQSMFRQGDWFAIICGSVSGGLEMIDFDVLGKEALPEGAIGTAEAWPKFQQLCKDHDCSELLSKLIMCSTKSGGIHVIYRCPGIAEGNQKLARTKNKEVLIETRGEGGYFLTSPTPGYKVLRGKWSEIPIITPEEREALISFAHVLNEEIEERQTHAPESQGGYVKRPGDAYNERASWHEILEPLGWVQHGKSTDGRLAWIRPGKKASQGIGATTGNIGRQNGDDLLYVHTTNAAPLDIGIYSKFAAFALLHHKGDFHFAAQDLIQKGYGQKAATFAQREKMRAIKGFDVKPLESYEVEHPQYLWDPYLRMSQINLLDAKGGAGKTTLCVALAAQGSLGILPFQEDGLRSFKTLLFATEDTPGEFRLLYDQIGGRPGYLIPCTERFQLDQDGIVMVEQTIEATGAKLVIFDAITYYVSHLIKNPLNGMEIEPYLSALREVARNTGCCIVNIRHFKKYSNGINIEEMGSGSEQWRNSHRSQLVLRPHPHIPRYGIVEHTKGSLNSPKGAPFAFHIESGLFRWVRNPDMTVFDEKDARGDMTVQDAEVFLRKVFENVQSQLSSDVLKEALRSGHSKSAYYRACKNLNIISTKRGYPDGQYHLEWPSYGAEE